MTTEAPAAAVAQWQGWHNELESERTAMHGSLAASGLYWLANEPERFEGVPGIWRLDGQVPVVDLDDGEELVLDGESRTGTVRFEDIPLDFSVLAEWGEVGIEVGERAGQYLVRPRRPDNPLRLTYSGTPTFDYDPEFVITAAFEPSVGVEADTGSVVETLRHTIRVAGTARFSVGGIPVTAVIFHHKDGQNYRILFRDRTGADLTYPASRSLTIDPSSGGGDHELILDFNRTWNLPCVYAPYWTCALPVPENTLPVRIEAGEKRPH